MGGASPHQQQWRRRTALHARPELVTLVVAALGGMLLSHLLVFDKKVGCSALTGWFPRYDTTFRIPFFPVRRRGRSCTVCPHGTVYGKRRCQCATGMLIEMRSQAHILDVRSHSSALIRYLSAQ